MGAEFHISVEGQQLVEQRLALLQARFGDLTPLMDIIGTVIESDTADNFAGRAWPRRRAVEAEPAGVAHCGRPAWAAESQRQDAPAQPPDGAVGHAHDLHVEQVAGRGIGLILLHPGVPFLHAGIIGPARIVGVFQIEPCDDAGGILQARWLQHRAK